MAVTLVTPTLEDTGVGMRIAQLGEAATVCMPVYKHTDGKYYKASNGSIATADVAGLVVLADSADAYTPIFTSGPINIASGTLEVGITYCLGGTAGSIDKYSDLSPGKVITILGTAITTSAIALRIVASEKTK